jgi:RHS repeat-associated protein
MPSAANAALTLVYDARNRLSRVDGSGGTVQANHYNGRGERVRKVAGALDRRFAYDESGRLLGEYDAGGVPLQLFVWMDDQPVAVVEGTALRYIETDHLNTPRALIDPARNVAVWRWDLQVSAFGEHAANEDPDADGSLVKFNLRFPGQYLDAETGLHYNYFRDYEAGTGRYVESDPIGLDGGVNTYSYVESNVLLYVDPKGLVRDRIRNVNCSREESEACRSVCESQGKTMESCKRVEKFKLVRQTRDVGVWEWVKINTSCSCNEPFCKRNPGTCAVGIGALIVGICLTPWPDDVLIPVLLGGAAAGS